MEVIQLENVSKFVLSDVNLYIPAHQSVGLIGESGAGKTTLLKLVSGLLAPSEGRVSTLKHNPVSNRGKYGRDFSAYFTGIPLLGDEDSVRTGWELVASMYKMGKSEFEEKYYNLSQRLGFAQYENQTVKSLSLGQRARAELGAALLYSPKLLLLDEPTIGLDQEAKVTLRDLLKERVEQGMTLLVSSHDMNEVSHLCTRVALLHKGKLEFYGEQSELHRKYHSLNTMKMRIDGPLPDLGDIPFHRYKIENDTLTLVYSSNFITSAEILRQIMSQTCVSEIVIRKSDLGQVITHNFP